MIDVGIDNDSPSTLRNTYTFYPIKQMIIYTSQTGDLIASIC